MPYNCCVPNCHGNYPNDPKDTLFEFPGDENLKQKWIHAIKRKDFSSSKKAKSQKQAIP